MWNLLNLLTFGDWMSQTVQANLLRTCCSILTVHHNHVSMLLMTETV